MRKLGSVEARVGDSLRDDEAAIRRFADAMLAGNGTRDDARAADAFVQRFEQLFEITLRRLFPATARVADVGDRADGLRELLDRLEKLGFIADAPKWVRRKDLRDRLVHEYPDDPRERAADLLSALDEAGVVVAELAQFRERLSKLPGEWSDLQ